MNGTELRDLIVRRRPADSTVEDELIGDQTSVFVVAMDICHRREQKYHGLWKQYGFRGCLGHLESKVARIRRAIEAGTIEEDVDDIIDLMNYTGFMARLVAFGDSGAHTDEEDFFEELVRRAKDPIHRARILEALGVNGGVDRRA